MAQVYRPPYTETDPKTGKKVRKRSRTWWIRYYTPDGERHQVKGFRDKRATETKAAELERREQRLATGLVDPTDAHAKRPLAEHAEDFHRCWAATGTDGRNPPKNLSSQPAKMGHLLTFPDIGDSGLSKQENPGKPAFSAVSRVMDKWVQKWRQQDAS